MTPCLFPTGTLFCPSAAALYYPQPSWSAFREPVFGHGRLELFNASHALWEWHRNPDPEATVSDSVWLVHNSFLNNGLQTGVSHLGGRTFDGYRHLLNTA